MTIDKSNFTTDAKRVLPTGETLCIMRLSESEIILNILDQFIPIEVEFRERDGYGLRGELFECIVHDNQVHYLTEFK